MAQVVRVAFTLAFLVCLTSTWCIDSALVQGTHDEITVNTYSDTPELTIPYRFSYALDKGTALGWFLQSDNAARLFDLIIFNDTDNVFGSDIFGQYEVNSSSSTVEVPSTGYWYVGIRRARFIAENYTVHVTGTIWQDGTSVPLTTTTTTTPATTTSTTPQGPPTTPDGLGVVTQIILLTAAIAMTLVCAAVLWNRHGEASIVGDSGATTLRLFELSHEERQAVFNICDALFQSEKRVQRYQLRNAIIGLISARVIRMRPSQADSVIAALAQANLLKEHDDLTVSLADDYAQRKDAMLK